MKNKKKLILVYVLILILSALFTYPILLTMANSLRHYATKTPVLFFGKETRYFENYYFAVVMVPFLRYLSNTMKIVVINVTGCIVFDVIYGYAFARLNAPGKNLVFKLVMIQLMVPFIAIQIPQFVFFYKIGLMNSYWVFALNAIAGNAYNIFMVKQFMASFPRELEEAAKIDGCGFLRQFIRVVIPCCKPLVVLLFFNAFLGAWNEYMGPQLYFKSDKYPLSTALFGNLYYMASKPEVPLEPIRLAACLLFTVPIFILFFFCQKYLVQGIVTTGLKE